MSFALAISVGLGLYTGRARADDRRFELELDTAPGQGCSSASELQARVDERVGNRTANGQRLQIHVRLRSKGDAGWIASVSATDDTGRQLGTRTLSDPSDNCQALDLAVVLVAANLVGIERETSAVAGPTLASPNHLERAAPVPNASHEPAPASQPKREFGGGTVVFSAPGFDQPGEPWQLRLGLGARGITGLLPGALPAYSLLLSASSGSFQVFAGAAYAFDDRVRVGASTASAFSVMLGEAGVCTLPAHTTSLMLGFCAGAQAGAMRSTAPRLWLGHTTEQPLVLLAPSVRSQFALGSALAIHGAVGAAFPLLFPNYYFLDAQGQRQQVHAVEMGLFAEIGLAVRLLR